MEYLLPLMTNLKKRAEKRLEQKGSKQNVLSQEKSKSTKKKHVYTEGNLNSWPYALKNRSPDGWIFSPPLVNKVTFCELLSRLNRRNSFHQNAWWELVCLDFYCTRKQCQHLSSYVSVSAAEIILLLQPSLLAIKKKRSGIMKKASFKFRCGQMSGLSLTHTHIHNSFSSFIFAGGPVSLYNSKAKPPIIQPIFICLCNGHSLSFFHAFSLSHGSCLQCKARFLLTFVQLQLFM